MIIEYSEKYGDKYDAKLVANNVANMVLMYCWISRIVRGYSNGEYCGKHALQKLASIWITDIVESMDALYHHPLANKPITNTMLLCIRLLTFRRRAWYSWIIQVGWLPICEVAEHDNGIHVGKSQTCLKFNEAPIQTSNNQPMRRLGFYWSWWKKIGEFIVNTSCFLARIVSHLIPCIWVIAQEYHTEKTRSNHNK